MAEAYCVKCKDKKEVQNGKEVEMKGKGNTKRKALTGNCPTCNTKMFKILSSK